MITFQATPSFAGDRGPSRVFVTLNQALEWAEFAADMHGVCYACWQVESEGDAVFVRCLARFPGRLSAA